MKQGIASSAITLLGSFLPLVYEETVAVMMMLTQEEGGRVMVAWWTHILTTQFRIQVAAVLCGRGAVKYVVREGAQVSSEFILTNIYANITKIIPREAALFLGTALLWAYYDDETSQIFPQPYVEEIKAKMALLLVALSVF